MKHKKIRLIARLDIKGPNLIKGIHLEGLRVLGDPQEYASKYYLQGADELIYIDIVASLYGRSKLPEIVSRTVEHIFVPLTVGGGIRNIDDVKELLRAGADKVAINTAAVQRPELISEVSRRFGSQCMVLSIEAKKQSDDLWEVYTDSGREKTGIDVVEWVKEGVAKGAGEILLTSIDCEGTRKGFDIELIQKVTQAVNIPVIASGGMGCVEHLRDAVQQGGADAIAMADILHYERSTIPLIREDANQAGIDVRRYEP
ncbi:imidazole glycerol phosphate synthase subunit HisF [Gammaproteobacteria bacterium]|jgi:imidazole glycerol-phosphate synthase subunit HisF|nr:imidazole glycerol phosphate synthase subunit HisF [Gammaproteobacteria bacterium]|tara:strand:+ start:8121 stop:8894 length:774 start_codon:yes stop_codon:yes gene_type:complete